MASFRIIENSRLTNDTMKAILGGSGVVCRPAKQYENRLCANWYENCPRKYINPDEDKTCHGGYKSIIAI